MMRWGVTGLEADAFDCAGRCDVGGDEIVVLMNISPSWNG
jgi:hypothetical protein